MDLDKILAEVEADLAKEGFALAKADDDKDDAGSAAPEASASAPAGPPPGADAAPPDASAAPAPDMAPPAAAPDASADPAAAPADGSAGPPDMEALKSEYSALPVDELQMHFVAVKAALMAKMGSQSPSMAPDMGPDQGASAPPAADPSASSSAPVPAMKGEMSAVKPGLGASASMAKSESAMRLMEEQIEMLTKAVELVVGAPQRKSVKGVSELQFLSKGEETVKKAETLTAAQIREKLSEKARNPSLSKSDKNAIVAYSIGTDLDLAKIEHLLA